MKLPPGVTVRDDRFVHESTGNEVAEADTLGLIADTLRAALAAALDGWEEDERALHRAQSGRPFKEFVHKRIAELRKLVKP